MTQWSISLDCFGRGLLRHKPMRKAWALLQRPHPHRHRTSGVSYPHRTRASGENGQPRPYASGGSHPHRPRATCRRLRWTPTSRRSLQKCRASGPSRPHAGEGLSRPRVSWCSAGLAGSSAHSYQAGRWMCLKGTPWCRPQGFLRGGATTDSGQARGRDQGSEWN